MMKKVLIFFSFIFIAINSACQSATLSSNNANASQGNLPEGISTKPLPANGERPAGIPDAANVNVNLPKGTTPTPGIPDPKTIGKTPMPKGTPPIPGIPDEETLRKQMNQIRNNSNAAPPAQNQPNSATNQNAQPRTTRKNN